MNKKPVPKRARTLYMYAAVDGGGCVDLATVTLGPGVGIYHEHRIEEMLIAERVGFVPYLLSVLSVLGNNPQGE